MDAVVLAMYLNIVEYIDGKKQKDLMEMIGLSEKIEGIISQIRNDGERNIINRLIDNFSSGDGSDKIIVSKATLLSMLQK